MKDIKNILIAAKELIQKTGWCQGQYALKNGKTFYNFIQTDELADSYCLTGALSKVAYDFWMQEPERTHETHVHYNKLSYAAGHLICKLHDFDGCPADWNDQDAEAQRLAVFTNELREKKIPRDQARIEINKFKQELKKLNIQPLVTKEIVLAALDKAIQIS